MVVSSSIKSTLVSTLSSTIIGGGLPTYSPLAGIAGASLWLDGSEPATIIASGNDLYAQLDKSGNGNNAIQATQLNTPKTGTRTLNSKNVIDYDGTNSYLTLLRTITSASYTVAFVALVDSLSTNPRDIVSSTSAGAPEIRFANSASNGSIQVVRRSQSVLLTSSTANSANTAYCFICTTSNSGNAVFKNGVANGSNATSASYSAGINLIGATKTGSIVTPHDGIIAELLIYPTVLSGANITSLDSALRSKWGI